MRSFARNGRADFTSVPMVKSAWITPARVSSRTRGTSPSPGSSATTRANSPVPAPRAAAVMAMRTAALPAPVVQGWSGTANTRWMGCFAVSAAATTRRQNTCRSELEVISPKREIFPAARSCADFHQKCSARSADLLTRG